MSAASGRRARRRRRTGLVGWALRLLAGIVVFAAGVAVGQALEDRPAPGRPVTSFATIEPWTQTGGATVTRQTVTVP